MVRSALTSALICCALAGCDSGSDPVESSGWPVTAIDLPLGKRMTYEWSTSMVNQGGSEEVTEQFTIVLEVVGVDEEVGSYSGLTRVETRASGTVHGRALTLGPDYEWYQQREGRLLAVAYSNPVSAPNILSKEGGLKPHLTRLLGGSPRLVAKGDTTLYEDLYREPLLLYQYPLEEEQAWTVLAGTYSRPAQRREVVAREEVDVVAGRFDCAKIDVFSESEGTSTLLQQDFVSEEGLILRTAEFDGSGSVVGRASTLRVELISIER